MHKPFSFIPVPSVQPAPKFTPTDRPSGKRVEKPLGPSLQDIHDLEALKEQDHHKFIMVGFQYLQKSAFRKALAHWQSGLFGQPVHFRAEYLHSSYLDAGYRQKHPERLQPIPVNGAAADLGSHPLSLLTAFLVNRLIVRSSASSGNFDGFPQNSDLCTTALIEEPVSSVIGTMDGCQPGFTENR